MLAESAACLLLLDTQLWYSLDVSIAMTDASVLGALIFILLLLGGLLINGRWSCHGER
jgi:hypothetical protein